MTQRRGIQTKRVHWNKTRGKRWYKFWTADLSVIGKAVGVYIIARAVPDRPWDILYVGKGQIRERLRLHRMRSDLVACRGEGMVVFTWTEVTREREALCVEGYLIITLKPRLCFRRYLGETPVNIPGCLKPEPDEAPIS